MSSNLEKQINYGLEKGIEKLIYFIGKFFKDIFLGLKKLKNKYLLIGFLISFFIPILARANRNIFFGHTQWYIKIIYFILLITPVIYLIIISKIKNKNDTDMNKFTEGFKALNFIGLDGKYPTIKYFNQNKETGFNEYSFHSLIPFEIWEKKKTQIETVMNISIFGILQGDDKQTVIINAIDGDAKIKKMLEWNDEYIKQEGQITLGRNAIKEIGFDLNKAPHVLAAGETGSGKSVILRCIFWQMLMQGAETIMIDFKGGLEFGKKYEEVGEVITEVNRANEVFEWLVKENDRRMKLLRECDCKNIKEYNRSHSKEPFRRIGVFVDEMAQLMDSKGVDKETAEILNKIEGNVATLARLSRATGINLILGLQRPDAKVLPGQIKNNVPVRICGRFADGSASEIVLNNTKATKLADIKGRFLFKIGADTIEFQSFFFDDEKNFDITKVDVNLLKNINKNKKEADYVDKKLDFKKEIQIKDKINQKVEDSERKGERSEKKKENKIKGKEIKVSELKF